MNIEVKPYLRKIIQEIHTIENDLRNDLEKSREKINVLANSLQIFCNSLDEDERKGDDKYICKILSYAFNKAQLLKNLKGIYAKTHIEMVFETFPPSKEDLKFLKETMKNKKEFHQYLDKFEESKPKRKGVKKIGKKEKRK